MCLAFSRQALARFPSNRLPVFACEHSAQPQLPHRQLTIAHNVLEERQRYSGTIGIRESRLLTKRDQ